MTCSSSSQTTLLLRHRGPAKTKRDFSIVIAAKEHAPYLRSRSVRCVDPLPLLAIGARLADYVIRSEHGS